jgi:prepilin-type N-terminal cleavage/methylation domain-containing protein
MNRNRQRGFSLLELLVVVVLILVLSAMMVPKMLGVIDDQKLRASAQAYAGLMQIARSRATQDNSVYQVLNTTQSGVPIAYVDLNFDRTYQVGEPMVLLAAPITISETGVPSGFGNNTLLGVQPYADSTSPMVSDGSGGISSGTAIPGVAFNERGLPCQRIDAAQVCKNAPLVGSPATIRPIAYITYLQYARRTGGTAYAAITVTPAGRVKTWIYQSGEWE